ncbi:MAG: hypothetical protein WCL34_08490 [Methylococcaceae bacterium]
MSRKTKKVIKQYKLLHEKNVAIGLARLSTRDFMAESFGLSRIFGGRYGY